jgi:hypothetical protein
MRRLAKCPDIAIRGALRLVARALSNRQSHESAKGSYPVVDVRVRRDHSPKESHGNVPVRAELLLRVQQRSSAEQQARAMGRAEPIWPSL